jgi:DNA-binding NtrC family response regulator
MYMHRRKELCRQWTCSSRPAHEHQAEPEYTVNGYSTGLLACTICGETVGTTRPDYRMAYILLVDDNQTFLYASRELLLQKRPTFVVDVALDAETALSAIRTHDYDVVVSDLVLPHLDGIALLSECQQIRRETPVVLMSGYGNRQLEQMAAERGAYAFLHKPVDPDAFLSVVNRAVLVATLRRQPEQVLGDDSAWYPQAVEQARQKSKAIAERLRKTIEGSEPPPTQTP